jgi:hypothetical protein
MRGRLRAAFPSRRRLAVAAKPTAILLILFVAAPLPAEQVGTGLEPSIDAILPVLMRPPSMLESIEPGFLRVSVKAAVEEAAQRVGLAQCQVLFSEFHDDEGRLLRLRLDESRLPPEEFLRTIRFVSGAGRAPCASSAVLAYSTPGLRTVAVCPDAFNRTQRSNPELASYIVIHELLHTLGLGENPPTSLEITARVRKRCAKLAIASH